VTNGGISGRPVRDQGTKRGRGTKKQPVFGILCRNGLVWAEVVDDVEVATLQPLITKQVSPGSVICSDTWRGYTGIASRGFVHCLVNHGEEQNSDEKGNHINGLEGFWRYLKRKLASKEESDGRNYHFISVNVYGDTITERKVIW
jgi:transposase-like protein